MKLKRVVESVEVVDGVEQFMQCMSLRTSGARIETLT